MIIQQAVTREVSKIFPDHSIVRLATHSYPSQDELRRALACDWILIGGSNIIGSYGYLSRGWKLGFTQIAQLRGRLIIFGGGWGWYQDKPTLPAKWMLRTLLSSKHIHSVRDGYTEKHLRRLGFDRIVNTSCPTLWPMLERNNIPSMMPAQEALLMLTDYRPSRDADAALARLLLSRYEKVHLWLQGEGDENYVRSLLPDDFGRFSLIPHQIEAFEAFLATGLHFDYIGTRLHGGIRCLVAGRRALTIAVDNRAAELARDVGLPVVLRGDLRAIDQWISHSTGFTLNLPTANIQQWKDQFRAQPHHAR